MGWGGGHAERKAQAPSRSTADSTATLFLLDNSLSRGAVLLVGTWKSRSQASKGILSSGICRKCPRAQSPRTPGGCTCHVGSAVQPLKERQAEHVVTVQVIIRPLAHMWNTTVLHIRIHDAG